VEADVAIGPAEGEDAIVRGDVLRFTKRDFRAQGAADDQLVGFEQRFASAD
jgi:hypothetical protein